jgi:hypothetical protein
MLTAVLLFNNSPSLCGGERTRWSCQFVAQVRERDRCVSISWLTLLNRAGADVDVVDNDKNSALHLTAGSTAVNIKNEPSTLLHFFLFVFLLPLIPIATLKRLWRDYDQISGRWCQSQFQEQSRRNCSSHWCALFLLVHLI